jgi:Ca2+/Na+ antiporter
MSVAAIYAMSLSLPERHTIHLMFMVMSALFLLVDANQAGIPFFGNHPRVSKNGRNVCIVFCLLWIVSTVFNYLAFSTS